MSSDFTGAVPGGGFLQPALLRCVSTGCLFKLGSLTKDDLAPAILQVFLRCEGLKRVRMLLPLIIACSLT